MWEWTEGVRNGPIRLSHLITTVATTTLLHYLRYLGPLPASLYRIYLGEELEPRHKGLLEEGGFEMILSDLHPLPPSSPTHSTSSDWRHPTVYITGWLPRLLALLAGSMPPIACFPPVYHFIKFHSCATVHSAGRGAFSFPLRGKRLFWIEIIHAVEGGWSPNRILILFIYSFPFFFKHFETLSKYTFTFVRIFIVKSKILFFISINPS